MADITTVSSKFQISIPKRVRDNQGWRAGQRLAFLQTADGVALVPVPSREDLFGIGAGADASAYRDRGDRF